MKFLLIDLIIEVLQDVYTTIRDTIESWKPRKRSEEEEKLTEFEKKHYREAENDTPRHR